MKKLLAIFCILALVLSFAACTRPLPVYTPSTRPEETSASSQTDAPAATEAPVETIAPAETDAPFVAPALSECVGLYAETSVSYSDGYNDYDATYQLPELLLNSSDAKRANDLIRSTFQPSIDESLQQEMDKVSLFCFGISYEAWIYDRYLSLVITENNDWDCTRYMVFSFDLTDGSWLGNEEFADYLGMSETDLRETIRSALTYHYIDMYSDLPDEYKDEFYDAQLAKQSDDEYVDETELFIGKDGTVQMSCYLCSIAGADSYAHLLPLILIVN